MKDRSQLVAPLIVAIILLTIMGVFWPTFSYMFGVGSRPDNHTNSAFVIGVFLVLIWSQRADLSILPIHPYAPGLIGAMGVGFVWLIGQLLFTRVLTQFAVLAMVPAVVLTLLGYRWFMATLFPCFVLLFALPLWGPLVPTLVRWTAKFVEMGIQLSGVPIYREGAFFVIPSGNWSIADSCSGIAYLSTCAMLGVLYAWTMYQSMLKRIVFVTGAIIIGIIGNWIRAYLTIIIAHTTDNRLLRDDHSTFGWILFAIFLFLYFRLGWTWRDKNPQGNIPEQSTLDANQFDLRSREKLSALRVFAVSTATLAALVAWPLLEKLLSVQQRSQPINIATITPQSGWSTAGKPSVEWTPELQNPSRVRVQTFEKAGGYVDVFIGVFRNQTWDSKLVTVSNQLANSDKHDWTLADRGTALTELSGQPLEVKTGVLLGRSSRIFAWHWYWVDGAPTGSDVSAKIHQLLARLRGKDDTAAWVEVYSDASASSDAANKTLQEFMREMGGAVEGSITISTKR